MPAAIAMTRKWNSERGHRSAPRSGAAPRHSADLTRWETISRRRRPAVFSHQPGDDKNPEWE